MLDDIMLFYIIIYDGGGGESGRKSQVKGAIKADIDE